jgi:trehalose 6-phosphate phosphatase
MRDILARASRDAIETFAGSRVLLAFDFDGTLAPIVREPDRARMRASTRRLLRRVARSYPCIVLSGRSRADVERRVRGVGFAGVVGNHGLEPWHATTTVLDEVRKWAPLLQERLRGMRGVVIEDKGHSVAVHYRRARDKTATRARILTAAAGLGEVRLVGGKQVLNVLPAGAPHKGTALERARTRLRCDTALYVGDDETDEDVFTLDQPGRLLTVRVGRRRDSAADYCIRSQADIDRLLLCLLACRPRPATGRGGRYRHPEKPAGRV